MDNKLTLIQELKNLETRTKIRLIVYLVLLIISGIYELHTVVVLVFVFSPLILLYITLSDANKRELQVFFVFMVSAFMQIIYYLIYHWIALLTIFHDPIIWKNVIFTSILLIISVLAVVVLPRYYYKIKPIVRRSLAILYIVLFYLGSLFLIWFIAWTGVF
ncbi:hypothetical protein [Candidatus Xianfuyuplasma coldseepsis]|uniref:Uncharacterized protein n=1 Tax=Candidatus Xianfuyuplasma coldseepsis TaxID=2782163 RepID=A0A7L7KTQ7_9MOLU|nr:hypothetical protein [Xianfuyuplasma coldseepsis]QMS85374.1 hypothetical protein G4Z02_06280 [Xianfuyuplasma coldseepsis]